MLRCFLPAWALGDLLSNTSNWEAMGKVAAAPALEPPSMSREGMLCAMKAAARLDHIRWFSEPLVKSHWLEKRYEMCAVISSSGVLRRHHHGKEIDAAQMVLRFNTAPTDGFERFVGTRDDVRVLNSQIAGKILYNKSLPGDGFNSDGSQLQLKNSTTFVAFVNKFSEAQEWENIKKKHPDLDLHWGDYGMHVALTQIIRRIYTDEDWYGLTPEASDWLVTTGAVGMLLALDACDEVRAYGMADSNASRNWPYHYFDDHTKNWHWKANENLWKRMFNVEKDLWRRVASNSDEDVEQTDVVVIPGFARLDCSGVVMQPLWRDGEPQGAGGAALPPCVVEGRMVKGPCMKSDDADRPRWRWFGLGVAATLAGLLPVAICWVVRGKLWEDRSGRSTDRDASCRTPVATSPSVPPPDRSRLWATSALPIYVSLLIGCDLVASATAQANGGSYPWDPVFIALIVEVAKCTVSLCMVVLVDLPRASWANVPRKHSSLEMLRLMPARENPNGDIDVEAAEPPLEDPGIWLEAAVRLLPVALLYASNNCLVLVALSKVHLDAYVVWRNSAILFNALIWSRYFGRDLQRNQVLAVVGLTVGCCLSSFEANGSWSPLGWPVAIVLVSALLSATAAVLNEAVLKAERCRDLGVNRLNVLLYAQTSCILLLGLASHGAFRGTPWRSVVAGFNGSALGLITMQTLLGLVISRVLVYANSVAKTMAGGFRELGTSCIAPLFVASRFDWVSVASVLWVFFAVVLYFVPRLLRDNQAQRS